MICKVCGSEMGLIGRYGDGHVEPREEVHRCYECKTEHNYNQSIGEWWDYDKTDKEYLEGFKIEEEI